MRQALGGRRGVGGTGKMTCCSCSVIRNGAQECLALARCRPPDRVPENKCVNRAYGAGVAEGLCGIGVWLSIF